MEPDPIVNWSISFIHSDLSKKMGEMQEHPPAAILGCSIGGIVRDKIASSPGILTNRYIIKRCHW